MNPVPQTPINIFSHQIEAFTAASEQKQKAGLLTRQEKYRCADIAADMNRYLQTVKAELLSGGDEIFDRFRGTVIQTAASHNRHKLKTFLLQIIQNISIPLIFLQKWYGI